MIRRPLNNLAFQDSSHQQCRQQRTDDPNRRLKPWRHLIQEQRKLYLIVRIRESTVSPERSPSAHLHTTVWPVLLREWGKPADCVLDGRCWCNVPAMLLCRSAKQNKPRAELERITGWSTQELELHKYRDHSAVILIWNMALRRLSEKIINSMVKEMDRYGMPREKWSSMGVPCRWRTTTLFPVLRIFFWSPPMIRIMIIEG